MILWDTGPLYAAFDRRDKHHEASAALMRRTAPPLLVPAPVVIETCYHLTKHLGARAEIALLKTFQGGDLAMVTPTTSDFDRAVELVEQYAGFPLGITDAYVVAIAERLDITRLATIDRRHFLAVTPRHCPGFELLPA
ncbi:PIN domain-containing protein [Frankia sp. AgPm24]|uniref:type II toxin-antitoxin system VapC family toxin n=1 Tax=Frankia sp. AgPm24 TaxID=631128 RepID=UPI002010539F|nr:PIN domain-containing protein [Frankia sp. AgPm24]MCK9921880.1 PIN domain-containing protein [Frankia sp. AgPm24]